MLPVVRLFVACLSDAADTRPLAHSLADLAYRVTPEAGQSYPLSFQQTVWLYIVLTGGRGRNEFQACLRHGVGPAAQLVWQSPTFTMDMGADPLAEVALPFQLREVILPRPGQYEFNLLADGVELDTAFYLEARG